MIKLTKIFDLLGLDTIVKIYEGNSRLYYGKCGECTKDIWRNAYIKEMKFEKMNGIYTIHIRYM